PARPAGPGRLHAGARRLPVHGDRPGYRGRNGEAAETAIAAVVLHLSGRALVKLRQLVFLVLPMLVVAGCSIPERGPGVPQAYTERALPLGLANARFFADGDPRAMMEEGVRSVE